MDVFRICSRRRFFGHVRARIRSCGSVACMSEVIGAFLRTEFGGEDTDPARETRNGSLGCFS